VVHLLLEAVCAVIVHRSVGAWTARYIVSTLVLCYLVFNMASLL
jgi:hypothetical protein